MYKKNLSLLAIIASSLITTGCAPMMFGVPQPTWDTLGPNQQQEVIRGHYKTRVAEIKNEPYYSGNREYRTENTYVYAATPTRVYTANPTRVYVASPPVKHYYVDNTRTVNNTIIETAQHKNHEHHKHHESHGHHEPHKHHEHHKKHENETHSNERIYANTGFYKNLKLPE